MNWHLQPHLGMEDQQMTWHGSSPSSSSSFTCASMKKASKLEIAPPSRGVNMAFEEEASFISAHSSLHARSHSLSEPASTVTFVNDRKRIHLDDGGLDAQSPLHPKLNGLRSNKPSVGQHHILGAIRDGEALSFSAPLSSEHAEAKSPELAVPAAAETINGNSAVAAAEEIMFEPQFKHGYDDKIFDITKVASSDFANQITLLFLPVFKAIKPDELTCMGWTRKDKCQVSPNVVEFTKLFNNINFWVQEECLKERVLQRRAEVLGHFVKIAKDLLKLNNIHGSMAVLAALQSEPIYRLKKTWSLIGNRQHAYDKLCQIFNQESNRINLRNYMMHLKLPVIPYLGMYTNDLVYIDTMYPSTGEFESQSRKDQVNNLLRTLAEFQRSVYNINVKHYLLEYLQQKHYIEELQTFLDKENHETSLRLEPDQQQQQTQARRLAESFNSGLLTVKTSRVTRSREDLASPSVQLRHPHRAFAAGHRKSKSLGSDLHSGSAQFLNLPLMPSCTGTTSTATSVNASAISCHSRTRNLVDDTPLCLNSSAQFIQHKDSVHATQSPSGDRGVDDIIKRLYSPSKARSPEYAPHVSKDRRRDTSSGIQGQAAAGKTSAATAADKFDNLCSGSSQHARTASMLAAVSASSKPLGQQRVLSGASFCSRSSSCSQQHQSAADAEKSLVQCKSSSPAPSLGVFQEPFICEGCVRRKTVMRAGRQIHAKMYSRFWLALTWQEPQPILLYFGAKSWSGTERNDFKRSPSKVQNIADCLLLHGANTSTFQLVSVATGLTYKFRLSESNAGRAHPNVEHWLEKMNILIKKSKEPKDLISF